MPIRDFETYKPKIHPESFIDETAVVIGQVEIQALASLWPNVVARGDVERITIGEKSNIQDNSVLHVTHDGPYTPGGRSLEIGSHNTIGHSVTLHACTLKDFCLIGIGSIVLDGSLIESQTMIGAGSLVPPGKRLEGGHLWLGRPVRKIRPLNNDELENLNYSANHYVKLFKRHWHETPPHES